MDRIADPERELSVVITDPRQADNPIVFVNNAFLRLTGYEREEVLGRNCRFLQGPDTDPDAVAAIRDALEQRRKRFVITIFNYRKDGTPFLVRLAIRPSYSPSGELDHFIGLQQVVEQVNADAA